MELSSQNVIDTFMECLYKEGENTEGYIVGEGVMMKCGFHPDRLKTNTGNIEAMLGYLPDSFKSIGGGGMSFLNMCNDKNGRQWADLHQTMDQLVCLGNAIGKMKFLMPRDMWFSMPGGMPYIVVG